MLDNLCRQLARAIPPARFASGWWITGALIGGLIFWVWFVHRIVRCLQ